MANCERTTPFPGVARAELTEEVEYRGTAEALIAANLVRADELPGAPGQQKTVTRFHADGSPAKDYYSHRSIARTGQSLRLRIRKSDSEIEAARAQFAAVMNAKDRAATLQRRYDYSLAFATEQKFRSLLRVMPLYSSLAAGGLDASGRCTYAFSLSEFDIAKLVDLEGQMQRVMDAATVVARPEVFVAQKRAVAAARNAPLQQFLATVAPQGVSS